MPTLKELLKDKLNEKELSLVPNSYDTVGSIAIFAELKKELKNKEKIIAKVLMQNNSHILTIAKKTGKYSGKYRLPKISIIAGIKTKEAIHKENNCIFKLNIEKCYFSVRSANERLRISRLVKDNESVMVLFSGIAPFPLVIEKNSNPKEIYGIEVNKRCHKYAQENLKLNKSKKIRLIKGNVKKELPKLKKKFDRIIMPYPSDSFSYLKLALNHINKNGTIHFYTFGQEKDISKLKQKILSYSNNIKIKDILKAGHYSPYTYRLCFDLAIT